MDAWGRDRPTALVCGEQSSLTQAIAVELANRGFDVFLPVDLAPVDPPSWCAPRLHAVVPTPGATAEEGALLSASAKQARPLEVAAIIGRVDSSIAATLTTLSHVQLESRMLVVRQPHQRAEPDFQAGAGIVACTLLLTELHMPLPQPGRREQEQAALAVEATLAGHVAVPRAHGQCGDRLPVRLFRWFLKARRAG